MAHELELRAGRWSFAFTGDRSAIWHGHGQQMPADASIEAWIEQSGQKFEVEKVDLAKEMGHTAPWLASMTHGLKRKDNGAILSIAPAQWKPAQNSDAFEFLRPFIDEKFCNIDTAGVLFNGRICFVLAKTHEGFQLPGGDDTEGYMFVQISHDYGHADLVIPTAVRVVCNNTRRMALDAASEKKLRSGKFVHSKNTSFSVEKAHALIEAYRKGIGQYAEQAKFLATKRATPEQTRAYINKVFRLDEKLADAEPKQLARKQANNDKVIADLLRAIETQPGANMSAGSWWATYHGVTFWEDHGRHEDAADESIVGKLHGPHADRKESALKIALEMATAA